MVVRDIIEAIRSGNEKAFETFFKLEFNNVVFFVNQYLHDYQSSEDIAQEAFVAMWKVRETLDPEANIRAFIFTIARNKALNLLRTRFFTSNVSLEKQDIQIHIRALESPYVESRIDALNLEKLIEKVYAALPPKIKESFILSRQHGLTYEEIAKKRGVTLKTVEYHIGIALKVFRKKLKKYMVFF